MNIKKFLISSVAAAALTLASVIPAIAATTTVVTPSNMQGWGFINDTTDGAGSGTIVVGPGTTPLGVGSANLTLTGSSDGQTLAKAGFTGTKLTSFTTLKYSTYQNVSNTSDATAISLQFNIDKDVTDTDNTFQGRLVFEPYLNNGGTVSKGTWNQWDAVNGGNAKWWLSKSLTKFSNNCSQSSPCTLTQLATLYPNMGVHNTFGAVVLKAGSGWSDFNGNADALIVGMNGNETTYDFEPTVGPATHLAQCKNNGWKAFNNPSFSSEVACLQYVIAHQHDAHGAVQYTANGLVRNAQFVLNTVANKGGFVYWDANHDWYFVDITETNVVSKTAYFAGKVTKASNTSWVGQWLFAKVTDGTPDQIWGSFTTQTAAVNGVNNAGTPADGPFSVTSGDLVVQ